MSLRFFHRARPDLLMLGLSALALLSAQVSRGSGVCEPARPTATFQVLSFSAKKKELAVRRVDEVCDEVEQEGSLDEKWRKLRYVTIHDAEGTVVRAFVDGDAGDRKRLLVARPAEIRESALASSAQLATYLKAGQFQPLSPRSTSENGACSVRMVGEKSRGATNIRVEIRAGDEPLAMFRRGGEKGPQSGSAIYFLQPAQLVAIYTAMPQRYGMPPPQLERTPALNFLPLSKYPKLARCFQTAATPPAEPAPPKAAPPSEEAAKPVSP